MPTTHETAMAVGDVYAHALLEAANERGQTDEVAEEFADLVAYMGREPEFTAFMTALTIDDDVRRASLDRLFRGKMNDLLLNLLQVLNDRSRPELLPAVCERFRLRLQKQRGQVEVRVRTAVPLADDLRERLRVTISERLGRDAILIPRVDESLIGGLVVQVGDRLVDDSLSHQLIKLREQLLNRASAEIHSRRDYVVE